MTTSSLAEDLFGRLEAFDARGAAEVVREAASAGMSISDVVTEMLSPAQQWVGELWQHGVWSVAQEHAVTAIVDDLLGLLAARTPGGRRGSVVLLSAEGEWHVTPARMAALIWRGAGWQVTFLGGSTPPEHIRTTLDLLRADVIALSCTHPLALPGAARVAEALWDLGVPIMAGGRAFGSDPHRAAAVGMSGWAASAAEASHRFRDWMDRPPDRGIRLRTDDEELSLELRLPELVAAAERRLLQWFPPMRTYDPRRRARTREDLECILRFAAVSLLVGDDRIFHDFLGWLADVLEGRDVPREALGLGLEALLSVVGDLPRTAALCQSGQHILARGRHRATESDAEDPS